CTTHLSRDLDENNVVCEVTPILSQVRLILIVILQVAMNSAVRVHQSLQGAKAFDPGILNSSSRCFWIALERHNLCNYFARVFITRLEFQTRLGFSIA